MCFDRNTSLSKRHTVSQDKRQKLTSHKSLEQDFTSSFVRCLIKNGWDVIFHTYWRHGRDIPGAPFRQLCSRHTTSCRKIFYYFDKLHLFEICCCRCYVSEVCCLFKTILEREWPNTKQYKLRPFFNKSGISKHLGILVIF